jgi:Tfp pilus assembly protein PilF
MSGEVLVRSLAHVNVSAANNHLGHCYLMMDDLQQAYSAYQQALYHLRDPKVSHSHRMVGAKAKK